MKNSRKKKSSRFSSDYDSEFFRNKAERDEHEYHRVTAADQKYWTEHWQDEDFEEEHQSR